MFKTSFKQPCQNEKKKSNNYYRSHCFITFVQYFFTVDPTYKQLVSQKKVIVYANKNVGQCSTSTKKLNCWVRRTCIKYAVYGYKKRCVRVLVRTYCKYQITQTCLFCTKYYWRRCYKVNYAIKCYRGRNKKTCARKIASQNIVTRLVSRKIVPKY